MERKEKRMVESKKNEIGVIPNYKVGDGYVDFFDVDGIHRVTLSNGNPVCDCLAFKLNPIPCQHIRKFRCLGLVINEKTNNLINETENVINKMRILEMNTDGKVWTAKVQGTQVHTIVVDLVNNEFDCDCQDFYFRRRKKGEPCKHIKLVLGEISRKLEKEVEYEKRT
jgi:predicted nucleic acid-binding Zn finger protein